MIEVRIHPDGSLPTDDEVAAVYAAAFGAEGYGETDEDATRFATEQLPRHRDRAGFRFVSAWGERELIGFTYGYTGQRGQWWSDHVAEHAPADVVTEWLGGHFEYVELAVDPVQQGRGIGTALHDALLDGLPHDRALLTTFVDDRPATRLYRRRGWRLLVPRLTDTSALYGIRLRERRDDATTVPADVG